IESKATIWPSPLSAGCVLAPLPAPPPGTTLRQVVTPETRSRTKTCEPPVEHAAARLVAAESKASSRPSALRLGLALGPFPPAVSAAVCGRSRTKVAVTVVSPPVPTTQSPVPLHGPLQPPKLEPGPAAAVNVRPELKLVVQCVPHSMPGPVTVPSPVPALLTVSVAAGGGPASKVAITPMSAVSGTRQGAAPLQPPPDQPPKTEPAVTVAVRVTVVPVGNPAAHVGGHSRPPGALLTAPWPAPARVTVSPKGTRRSRPMLSRLS